jgi:NAD(P)-dependent dehydrogenase (short-subunit alcohol dehydrogenase family)
MTTDRRSVVVSGASTGIGKATALHLDQLGFRVFAGVRKESDQEALSGEASGNLTPVFLDVTDEASVAATASAVAEETDGTLFALINNAGLSLNGPLELLQISEIRKLFDVNVLGLLALTKACLPLLRKGQGRIVNVSSGHGLLAIPDKSAYAASKFGVQAVSDSLRIELKPFGVSVSSLVVGKVDTAVLAKILAEREAMVKASDPETARLYSPLMEFFDREVKDLPGIPPTEVAEVIGRVLRSAKPMAQYLVGPGARKMRNLARLPRSLRERMMYHAIYGRRNA